MFYEDLPRAIGEILLRQWSLPIGEEPTISFDRSAYFQESRVGAIFVYQTNRTNSISTTDYRTLERNAYVSIRLTNPDRTRHFRWAEEIYRIIMANRRAGPDVLAGYLFMEVVDDTTLNDPSGWFQTTIDLRFTTYSHPIKSPGFGVDCRGDPIVPKPDCL